MSATRQRLVHCDKGPDQGAALLPLSPCSHHTAFKTHPSLLNFTYLVQCILTEAFQSRYHSFFIAGKCILYTCLVCKMSALLQFKLSLKIYCSEYEECEPLCAAHTGAPASPSQVKSVVWR